jgi:hypothetical protein
MPAVYAVEHNATWVSADRGFARFADFPAVSETARDMTDMADEQCHDSHVGDGRVARDWR